MSTRAALAASTALLAIAATAAPTFAQSRNWDAVEARRYEECLAAVEADPERGYEEGLAWQFEGAGPPARHCVAVALIALGQLEEGAGRLEEAALAPDAGAGALRGEMLLQAGAAWLMADAPAEAERALTNGLIYAPGDPDLLIERGLARGLQHEWEDAARDLSIALTSRENDVEALRLRAEAYLQLGRYDDAEDDVADALALDPQDIETLVVRGRVREARRTGQPPDNVRLGPDGVE